MPISNIYYPRTLLITNILTRISLYFKQKEDCFCNPLQRKVRDSNPRNSYPFTAFRVRPVRPLRQLSLQEGEPIQIDSPSIKSREEM